MDRPRESFISTALLALGVGVLAALAAAARLPTGPVALVWFIAMVITVLTPFLVAASAARLAVDQFEASNSQPFTSFVRDALVQRRFVLAVAIGLIPLLALDGSKVAINTAISLNSGCLDGCFWPLFMPVPDFDLSRSVLQVVFAGWGIGYLGLTLTAAALGTGFALWRRSVGQGLILAALPILLMTVAVSAWLPTIVYALLKISTDAVQSRTVAIRLAAAFALAPASVGYLTLQIVAFLHNRSSYAANRPVA